MINTLINAMKTQQVDELKSLFSSSLFFRDVDGSQYSEHCEIAEVLASYHNYPLFEHTRYQSLDIIKLSANLWLKVKIQDNLIHKLYLREVPEGQIRLRIDFSYDGSHYHGLQRQNNHQPTIQKEIENTLKHLLQHDITAVFAGRTDKGVHAINQVAHLDTTAKIPVHRMKRLMNTMLPRDISINHISEVPPVFHARYDCLLKTYQYHIIHTKDPFYAHYTHYVESLDIERLNALLAPLEGTHDFIGFSKLSQGRVTKRTITHIQAYHTQNKTIIELQGEGFLRHMVRIIVGNALKDYQNQSQTILKALHKPSKDNVKYMAPAQGLYLKELKY